MTTGRSLRARSAATVLLAALAASTTVGAHRLDECLQAARIAVERERITLELDVTPGVAIADSLIPEIDRNRDGSISAREQHDFARSVLGSVDLSLDGGRLELTGITATFPELDALRAGEGMIRLNASAAIPTQSVGTHQVAFRNWYREDVSVYLANALVPDSEQVAITAQHHSAEQRDLTIAYELHAESPMLWIWMLLPVALAFAIFVLRPTPKQAIHRMVNSPHGI